VGKFPSGVLASRASEAVSLDDGSLAPTGRWVDLPMSHPVDAGDLALEPERGGEMATILVAYGTTEGKCRDLAGHIGRRVEAAGHHALTAAVEAAVDELVETADALVLVGSVHVAQHTPALAAFVAENRERIGRLPTAFLSVSLSATDPATRQEAVRYLDVFLAEVGWTPASSETVAGDLRYSRYGPLKRLFMRFMAGRKGLPTDTRRDHDLTDYEALDRFVDGFLGEVEMAEVGRVSG
jgi:menaquinone-dependent protoporphyrinogen oxidase